MSEDACDISCTLMMLNSVKRYPTLMILLAVARLIFVFILNRFLTFVVQFGTFFSGTKIMSGCNNVKKAMTRLQISEIPTNKHDHSLLNNNIPHHCFYETNSVPKK